MTENAKRLFPIFLDLRDKACLVVGGGEIAGTKAAALTRSGALVTLVAPSVTGAEEALDREGVSGVSIERRPYRSGELSRYWLGVAATGDPAVDSVVYEDGKRHRVFVNCVDAPAQCSSMMPAVHRSGPVVIAVSTSGKSPVLASWLRDSIASHYGEEISILAELLGEARAGLLRAGRPGSAVDWRALLDGPLPDLVRNGHLDEAAKIIRDAQP